MPHYDRTSTTADADNPRNPHRSGPDEAAMEKAAEALRQAEVEAVQPAPAARSIKAADLERMNIDELRALAKEHDIPDRASITEKDDLIAAIRQHSN